MATVIQVKRGTAAAWTSANTVLTAGEIGFESDTKKMKVGDGSTAWTSLLYTSTDGDITAVVAGTGLSGGGTSGSATLSIDTATTVDKTTAQTLTNKTLTSPVLTTPSISTMTTTGDILYASAANTPARLGIGTTGQTLQVAGGIPSWATASSGWTNLVASTAFGAVASVTMSSINQTYKDLRIIITGWSSATGGGVRIAFNDASTGYGGLAIDYTGTWTVSRTNNGRAYFQMGDSLYNTSAGDYFIDLPFYSTTNNRKFGQGQFNGQDGGSGADAAGIFNFSKSSTNAISSIVLSNSGGNFDAGNYELWGKN